MISTIGSQGQIITLSRGSMPIPIGLALVASGIRGTRILRWGYSSAPKAQQKNWRRKQKMKIEIPETIFGVKVKGALELALKAEENKQPEPVVNPIVISPRINPADYVKLGINGLYGSPVLISKFEIPGANSMNYENTHKFVLSKGLYVPTPRIFMDYFTRVVTAKNNRIALFDGNGSEINGKELDDIYGHLTTNHISAYGVAGQEGAWAWLNARFVPGSGFNNMDLETVISMKKDGRLEARKEPLTACILKDCFAELDFTSQGLAVKEAKNQKYIQGQNIRFWHPRENCVARFYAYSDWAGLGCIRNPRNSNSALGEFVCAVGAAQKNIKWNFKNYSKICTN